MSTNTILVGWNHSYCGREAIGAQHFQEFAEYLQAQQKAGKIESFEPVLLLPYGGTLNGFFMIKGEPQKLAALCESPEWIQHQLRANHHIDGHCELRAVSGAPVLERIAMWSQLIPR